MTTNPLIGKRVQIPAYLDAWMRGSRYGEITRVFSRKDGNGDYARITTDHGLKVVALLDDCTFMEAA